MMSSRFNRACLALLVGWVVCETVAVGMAAEDKTMAATNLPMPRIGVRQEDAAPIYGTWTFVWVQVPAIDPIWAVLDLLCYEHSGMTYLSHRILRNGEISLRHRSIKDPNVLLVTTVTPQPGSVELVARATIDRDKAPEGKLPDELPSPNLCFRVKRADGVFSHFPDPFPEFISRCFIFTEIGRTFLTDTVRRELPAIADKPDDPRNNPPWIQVYTPVWHPVPGRATGTTWYQSSTDRFTIPVIGVVSRDRKWLAAIANDSADAMTQAWQQCLHNNPKWLPAEAPPAERRWRVKIYFMPNDPQALLKRVATDFPDAAKLKENRPGKERP